MSQRYSKDNRNRLHTGDPCHYCSRKMLSPNILNSGAAITPEDVGRIATIDHVIPKSQKGSSDIENIVISCQRCNGLKGSMSYEIFIAFSRVIVKQYPNASIYVLRASLRQFVDSLAEIAIRNNRETKRALSIALLKLGQDMK